MTLRARSLLLIVCALLSGAAAFACDDSGATGEAPTRPPATSTVHATATQPAASQSAVVDTEVEVTGIVGAVGASTGVIEINRLSGAAVNRIETSTETRLRSPEGRALTLGQLRPSDRIVARGSLNERGDTLVAAEITVQSLDPAPGSGPGG
jgi:hypothetical protein